MEGLPNGAPSGEGPSKGKGKGKTKSAQGPILFHLAPLPGSNSQIDVDLWREDPSRVTHRGVFCKGPGCTDRHAYIQGTRYKCSSCPNVDYCDGCMRDPSNPHDREHQFWPCDGEAIFEDWQNMSQEEILEAQEMTDGLPEEYLTVPRPIAPQQSAAQQPTQALNLDQLNKELFGMSNQLSDDQLLIHWRNGFPAARLIDLLPGDGEEPLAYLLTSTRLDRPEPYEALCLAWIPGGADNQASGSQSSFIQVGDQFREITSTLAVALRAIRSTDEIKKMWVEELCVQQERPEFATFQERCTSLIFTRAERTIVWAGSDDLEMEAVWTLIEMLSHRCDESRLPSPADLENDQDFAEMDLLPVGSDGWMSLARFFPPHLFVQGWLLHDVAFASKAIVKRGAYELEWWQVARVRDMLAQPSWMGLEWRQPWLAT